MDIPKNSQNVRYNIPNERYEGIFSQFYNLEVPKRAMQNIYCVICSNTLILFILDVSRLTHTDVGNR